MTYSPLPNIPWEERPTGCSEVVWRYHANPIIPRNLIPSSNTIFNSAVVPFQGHYAGVFRCDNKKRETKCWFREEHFGGVETPSNCIDNTLRLSIFESRFSPKKGPCLERP